VFSLKIFTNRPNNIVLLSQD